MPNWQMTFVSLVRQNSSYIISATKLESPTQRTYTQGPLSWAKGGTDLGSSDVEIHYTRGSHGARQKKRKRKNNWATAGAPDDYIRCSTNPSFGRRRVPLGHLAC